MAFDSTRDNFFLILFGHYMVDFYVLLPVTCTVTLIKEKVNKGHLRRQNQIRKFCFFLFKIKIL